MAPSVLDGLRRTMSFGRVQRRSKALAADGALQPHEMQTTGASLCPPPKSSSAAAAVVSAPGSDRRAREIQDLLGGVGGGDATGWLRRAEEAIVAEASVDENPHDLLLLDERLFVRLSRWPCYKAKRVRREADHISIDGVGEGTVLESRTSNEYNYEITLVIQSENANLVVDLRCLKRVHYANLTRVGSRQYL